MRRAMKRLRWCALVLSGVVAGYGALLVLALLLRWLGVPA